MQIVLICHKFRAPSGSALRVRTQKLKPWWGGWRNAACGCSPFSNFSSHDLDSFRSSCRQFTKVKDEQKSKFCHRLGGYTSAKSFSALFFLSQEDNQCCLRFPDVSGVGLPFVHLPCTQAGLSKKGIMSDEDSVGKLDGGVVLTVVSGRHPYYKRQQKLWR